MSVSKIVNMDPSSLKDNPYQPVRRTDANRLRSLLKSIEDHGVLVPIAVTADGYKLDGHGRTECAIKLGLRKVPCIVHEGLTKENFGLLNQSTKPIGTAGWLEAFVRSRGVVQDMPKAERKRCEELLKIFKSYEALDEWFVAKGQGSNSVLKFMEQFTILFALSGLTTYPTKKQIGMWILHHKLAWVCRNLIKDLQKGKSNTTNRLTRLVKKISKFEAIDDEF